MTMRLLFPLLPAEVRPVNADERSRSFVYFGSPSPCAMVGPEGELRVPTWSRNIPIFPNEYGKYTHWTVKLMSMTLLVPQVTNPNYTKASTLDWEAIRIEMPAMDGQHGIRVELDSGSSVCLISKCVTDEIRKTWHKEEDIFVKELLIPGGKRSGCCVLLWGSALLSQPLEKRRRLPPTFHTTNRT